MKARESMQDPEHSGARSPPCPAGVDQFP